MLPITTNFELTRLDKGGYALGMYLPRDDDGDLLFTSSQALELYLLLGHVLGEDLLEDNYDDN
jgi:hypothetical protein